MTAMARWWQEEEIILSLVSEVNKKENIKYSRDIQQYVA